MKLTHSKKEIRERPHQKLKEISPLPGLMLQSIWDFQYNHAKATNSCVTSGLIRPQNSIWPKKLYMLYK